MDKEGLLKKSMQMSIIDSIKESLLGLCGDKEEEQMIAKMHGMLELCDKLQIDNFTINISLKELRKAKKQFDKLNLEIDE